MDRGKQCRPEKERARCLPWLEQGRVMERGKPGLAEEGSRQMTFRPPCKVAGLFSIRSWHWQVQGLVLAVPLTDRVWPWTRPFSPGDKLKDLQRPFNS